MNLPFYQSVLENIERLTNDRGLVFSPVPRFEWMSQFLVRPGWRTIFAIEGENSGIIGWVLVPEPSREFSNLAWNRIDEGNRERMRRLERDGYEGRKVIILLIQVWENERRVVLIPFKELDRLVGFRRTGDFRVKQDCGEFFLETPREEENVRLRDKIEKLFDYL